MSELRQLLTDARDLIREHGWVQQKLGSESEGFCLVGALVRAGREYFLVTPGDALELLGRVTGNSVIHWNDTEGRTETEVLEALELAIESA